MIAEKTQIPPEYQKCIVKGVEAKVDSAALSTLKGVVPGKPVKVMVMKKPGAPQAVKVATQKEVRTPFKILLTVLS